MTSTIFDMKKDFDNLKCQGIMYLKKDELTNELEVHIRTAEKEFPHKLHLMVIKIQHENLIIELS